MGHPSLHDLDLMKLITPFVLCSTDIVVLYTDAADEGACLHVESLLDCGAPSVRGERGSRNFMDPQHQARVNSIVNYRSSK